MLKLKETSRQQLARDTSKTSTYCVARCCLCNPGVPAPSDVLTGDRRLLDCFAVLPPWSLAGRCRLWWQWQQAGRELRSWRGPCLLWRHRDTPGRNWGSAGRAGRRAGLVADTSGGVMAGMRRREREDSLLSTRCHVPLSLIAPSACALGGSGPGLLLVHIGLKAEGFPKHRTTNGTTLVPALGAFAGGTSDCPLRPARKLSQLSAAINSGYCYASAKPYLFQAASRKIACPCGHVTR